MRKAVAEHRPTEPPPHPTLERVSETSDEPPPPTCHVNARSDQNDVRTSPPSAAHHTCSTHHPFPRPPWLLTPHHRLVLLLRRTTEASGSSWRTTRCRGNILGQSMHRGPSITRR